MKLLDDGAFDLAHAEHLQRVSDRPMPNLAPEIADKYRRMLAAKVAIANSRYQEKRAAAEAEDLASAAETPTTG